MLVYTVENVQVAERHMQIVYLYHSASPLSYLGFSELFFNYAKPYRKRLYDYEVDDRSSDKRHKRFESRRKQNEAENGNGFSAVQPFPAPQNNGQHYACARSAQENDKGTG